MTSPVLMRSAISVSLNMPSTMSIPWATNVKVTASMASNPPTSVRSRYTARRT